MKSQKAYEKFKETVMQASLFKLPDNIKKF